MEYELKLASRSFNNESQAKDVYGAITKKDSDLVVCYVPSPKMAHVVLRALNGQKIAIEESDSKVSIGLMAVCQKLIPISVKLPKMAF